jgi:hypothetical protein
MNKPYSIHEEPWESGFPPRVLLSVSGSVFLLCEREHDRRRKYVVQLQSIQQPLRLLLLFFVGLF